VAARRKKASAKADKATAEFVPEAEEILERMRDELSELAEHVDGDVNPETINGLFRSAHSLKGLSGMFGQEAMSELAHHLEDLLDRLRMGRAVLDRAGLALFDESVTIAATALEKIGDEEAAASLAEEIADLVGRIEAWTVAPAETANPTSNLDVPASMLQALTEYEEHRLQDNVERGRGIYVVDAEFEIANFEEGLHEIQSAIREVGEVLSTLPSPGGSLESHICFSLLIATELQREPLVGRLELSDDAVHMARVPQGEAASAAASEPAPGTPTEAVDPAQPVGIESEVAEQGTLKSISDTVRVDIRKLDELMNLVGELAVQRAAIQQIAARLVMEPATHRIGVDLDKSHKTLERKLQELQASVLEVRMVPLRQVFDKLTRVARRLRLDLGKEARLEIQGADTELDKLIVEELIDPLMHVVRNALDHAIEAPDDREAAGKAREGVIRIIASQRGNDVMISVTDDGRGIDADKVQQRAVEAGLIASDNTLTRKEVLDLVFHPGLSTRDEVTETSGRGVGMDVVRSNIGALGGLVDIDSVEREGTTLTITLPITLAIIKALIVGVGDHRFAIPLNSIRETLLVDQADIQRTDGRRLMSLRGDALPVCRLAEEFELDAPDTGKSYAVVLGVGDARLGLLVDRLEGQQDTVIKPIQGPIAAVRGIAGATEMGDQGAVLVLDVSAMVEDVVRKGEVS
jgi:two-component system chemotaxis sensor kinase CheA